MRVSIPGTILYPQGKIGTNLLRDIINAIYQYCLYAKKLEDEEKKSFENPLDERLLVNLWTHIIDNMGGRAIDVHLLRLTHILYPLALSAIVISIVSLVLSVSC